MEPGKTRHAERKGGREEGGREGGGAAVSPPGAGCREQTPAHALWLVGGLGRSARGSLRAPWAAPCSMCTEGTRETVCALAPS